MFNRVFSPSVFQFGVLQLYSLEVVFLFFLMGLNFLKYL